MWRVGNFWVYEARGDADLTGIGESTMRFQVVGREPVTVGGTTYEAYHTEMSINASLGSLLLNVPGEAWFRTEDLAIAKLTFTVTIEYPGQRFESTTTLTQDPPVPMEWPLTAGASWFYSSTVLLVIVATGQPTTWLERAISGDVEVAGPVDRTVPAGRFEGTMPVKTTIVDGNLTYATSYWSPEAGNFVEERSFDSNDAETGSLKMRSYSYAPPGGTVTAGTLLGLPWYLWILAAVGVTAVTATVLVRRRQRPKLVPPPPAQEQPLPAMTPQEPPISPEGPPPGSMP